MQEYLGAQPDKAFKNIKDMISVLRYHMDATVRQRLVAQKDRVGDMTNQLDTVLIPQVRVSGKAGAFGHDFVFEIAKKLATWIESGTWANIYQFCPPGQNWVSVFETMEFWLSIKLRICSVTA